MLVKAEMDCSRASQRQDQWRRRLRAHKVTTAVTHSSKQRAEEKNYGKNRHIYTLNEDLTSISCHEDKQTTYQRQHELDLSSTSQRERRVKVAATSNQLACKRHQLAHTGMKKLRQQYRKIVHGTPFFS